MRFYSAETRVHLLQRAVSDAQHDKPCIDECQPFRQDEPG